MEERALSGTEAAPVAAAPPAAVPEDQIPTPVAGEHTEEEPAAAIGEEDGSQGEEANRTTNRFSRATLLKEYPSEAYADSAYVRPL